MRSAPPDGGRPRPERHRALPTRRWRRCACGRRCTARSCAPSRRSARAGSRRAGPRGARSPRRRRAPRPGALCRRAMHRPARRDRPRRVPRPGPPRGAASPRAAPLLGGPHGAGSADPASAATSVRPCARRPASRAAPPRRRAPSRVPASRRYRPALRAPLRVEGAPARRAPRPGRHAAARVGPQAPPRTRHARPRRLPATPTASPRGSPVRRARSGAPGRMDRPQSDPARTPVDARYTPTPPAGDTHAGCPPARRQTTASPGAGWRRPANRRRPRRPARPGARRRARRRGAGVSPGGHRDDTHARPAPSRVDGGTRSGSPRRPP